MIVLKGKDSLVFSEKIELPDMAELLTYPNFNDVDIEDVYRYGSDFQRKLLDMSPIDPSKKYHSLLSGVKINVPDYRSCTGGEKVNGKYVDLNEWHIDNEERHTSNGSWDFTSNRDIVTLLTSKSSVMTRFLGRDYQLSVDPSKVTYQDVLDLLSKNMSMNDPMGIGTFIAPENTLITFTNHFHRAVPPSKIEFRYMFRLLQTDRESPPNRYNPEYDFSNIMDGPTPIKIIERFNPSKIMITMPHGFKDSIFKYNKNDLEES